VVSENRCENVRCPSLGLGVRSAAAAAVAVVAVIGGAPVATAESDHEVPVVFHYHGQPSVPDTQQCEKLNGVDGFAVRNPTVAGSAPGDTWHAPDATDVSCAYANPDGSLRYLGTETGTVTLDGCGTGLAVIEFDGSVTPPDGNGVRTDEASFRIVAAEGTDGMQGTSGEGTTRSVIYQDNSSDGVATGTAHCPHPVS
jgi:hypothetical protein